MNCKIYTWLAFVLLAVPILWLNCDGDEAPTAVDLNDPSTFPGSYKLVSLTDKTGDTIAPGFSANAGEEVQITLPNVGQVTIVVDGTLTLTSDRFTFIFRVTVNGIQQSDTITGTYTISGNIITTIDDADGAVDTATLSVSGLRVTFDADDVIFVFEKQ